MDELQIKAAVVSRLRAQGRLQSGDVIASEFCIPGTGVRADLAALSGGAFLGVEIKSAQDSLRRLDRQLEAYRSAFDQLILVVASRHVKNLSPEQTDGAELWVLGADGSLTLPPTRPAIARTGPEPDGFRENYAQFSRAFWRRVRSREVRVLDIERLSRFRAGRLIAKKHEAATRVFWSNWQVAASAHFKPDRAA